MSKRTTLVFLLFLLIYCVDEQAEKIEKAKQVVSNADVQLATLDWQPYVGQDLPNKGYVYQLIEKVFAEQGLSVSIQFLPFARIINLAASGQIDGYFPEYMNEDNAKTFLYSNPYPGGDVGFIRLANSQMDVKTKKNMNNFTGFSNLQIGVVRGYINTVAFDAADYLVKQETGSDLLNLKKLLFERIDLAFIDPNVANYLISTSVEPLFKQATGSTYQFIDPGLEYKELYICFPRGVKKSSKLLMSFNEGLQKLKQSGALDKILLNNGFRNGRYSGG
jgi:polar amino acid transport system substrate-binding protein